ncbi:MAG: homocysteine S-methyltransferase family protein [Vampirovibrionales bacterium]|nr:homocysteine S-methyltransferase family protein [Vampirovibrionales bacterium]
MLTLSPNQVLLFDGGMGTQLQLRHLTAQDFDITGNTLASLRSGALPCPQITLSEPRSADSLEGCNELLSLTRPDVIADIHRAYFEAGSDIVETNTFGANAIVLAEYLPEADCARVAYELNKASAQLAKKVADEFNAKMLSSADASEQREENASALKKYVAGSIGPGTKLPSLGHIDYDTLKAAYTDQARGLIDGGVDCLLVETCQDPLQIKAALAAIMDVKQDRHSGERRNPGQATLKMDARLRGHDGLENPFPPVIVQVTVETTGTLLVGSGIDVALTVLMPYIEHAGIAAIGLNCATGPQEMLEHVRYLCQHSPVPVSVQPNAGIPENIGGKAHYPLTPEVLAKYHYRFVTELGVSIVGACCGSGPEHIKAVKEALKGVTPAKRAFEAARNMPERSEASMLLVQNGASSLFSRTDLTINPPPILIGERTNANGSLKFRNLLSQDDYDGLVGIARGQLRQGAHWLDVCTAYVGRDEVRDMRETIARYTQQVDAPLVIDSTEIPVIREALKLIGGRAIVNSINLEDGEAKLDAICALCKAFGAAVVALTIDETGMAKTVEHKLAVAQRIYDLVTQRHGLSAEDLIFDPLTFTLGSGDAEFRDAGVATIEAIRQIKAQLPGVKTTLGVSNISFGLSPAARHVLNSVFLHEAVQAGLDTAIINSAHLMPYAQIPELERELCLNLIRNQWVNDQDPLHALMAHFEQADQGNAPGRRSESALPVQLEERLKQRIIQGEKTGLNEDLAEALKTHAPLAIINEILLDGMRVVGELFGAGDLQLPFVLQSAEVMKAAVAYLEPFMEKIEGESSHKGVMVIATVKGDVHDIGKNLVDILVSNNGYKVINLGIKQPLEPILEATREHNADLIAMSGLLVKSTVIMRENLIAMAERGLKTPVVLGGAALTPRFVAEDCQSVYPGRLFYGRDAFSTLHTLDAIMQAKANKDDAFFLPQTKDGNAPQGEALAGDGSKKNSEESVLPEEKIFDDVGDPLLNAKQALEVLDKKRSEHVDESNPIPEPPFYGTRIVEEIALEKIYPFVNHRALVTGHWQFKRGSKTKTEHEALLREQAYPILEELKDRALRENLLAPKLVYGFFPCQSEGNSLILYEDDAKTERLRMTFPRGGKQRLCLADFFASKQSGRMDNLAMQLVTMGPNPTLHERQLFKDGQFSEYFLFHGFSVEMAEALAEYWHKEIRAMWGIAGQDDPDPQKILGSHYQGERFSAGYPACPDLEDQLVQATLLHPERVGVVITENFLFEPEQTTSALILHHPQAHYFDVR